MRQVAFIFALIAIASMISADLLTGQQDGTKRPDMRPKPPIFVALDTDKDGKISASELANATLALRTLDKNGDAELTPDELRPKGMMPRGQGQGGPDGGSGEEKELKRDKSKNLNDGRGDIKMRRGRGPGGGSHPPMIVALDTDNNGRISAVEIDNAPTSLKTLDKNGDGELTHDEFRRQRRKQNLDSGRGENAKPGKKNG
ncbi:MAG: hypothetical protein GY940_38275 [bacterium]|nr:hypothetical protein [bacterium]